MIRDTIRLDWAKLASKTLDAEKRKAMREHLELCTSTLKNLQDRLNTLPARSASQKPKLKLREGLAAISR